MISKSLAAFIQEYQPLECIGNVPMHNNGISDNSRAIQDGYIFVAYKGPISDGHTYIQDAIDNGATVIVLDNPDFLPLCETVCALVVSDSKSYLTDLAWWWYDNPTRDMTIVGVTGTNGKTTIATTLYNLWKTMGIPAGLISTVEHRIGNELLPSNNTTPGIVELAELFARMRDTNIRHAVMEVSSHALHQHRVSRVPFLIGVFSNLTQDHLDYHGTMNEYHNAKRILFEMLPESGYAIGNSDDSSFDTMVMTSQARVVRVGMNSPNDYHIHSPRLESTGTSFLINDIALHTQFIGTFNIYNMALVFAIAQSLGYETSTTVSALGTISAPPGRAQLVHAQPVVLVDYAHTPDGLQKILELGREISHGKPVCVVFGCGGDRDTTKRPIMGSLAATLADVAILTSDNPRTEDPDAIIEDIKQGLTAETESKVITITDRTAAIHHTLETYADAIIIIAGKGHENYQIIGTTKHHFDDAEIVREFFANNS
jgi:UDP-N-acetylmuramoyl-L-alanyl-D-glutamate--2,6-diaminopimelate ligase